MIICDKCGKPINELLPCKVYFSSAEMTRDFSRLDYDITADVCIDCQAEILETLGKPLTRFDKEKEGR